MAQPVRRRGIEKKQILKGTGKGLDYCNECPFLSLEEKPFCNPNDKYLKYKDINKIPVPTWCGNHKKDEKRLSDIK